MALLVHLPLLGNLNNQGLAEITYTGTPVFKTTGKIGNSAFDLSHRVTFNCPSLDGVKTFSIAFWAKVNSDSNLSTNWVDVISFTDRKSDGSVTGVFRWETCYGGTNYTNWGISVHDNGYYNISSLAGIPQATGKNIWHHIVMTVDLENNEVKEYLNGVLVGTATCNGGSLTGAFHLGENNLINGEIQDVRIYSHCLSQKEISELKKALVLHYSLDGNNGTLATPNLLTKTASEFSNWTNINPDCVTVTSDNYKNVYLLTQGKSGKWENVYSPAITVEANKEYTISCLYKVYDDYNYTTSYGDFGLTVMKAVPTNANPTSNTIARACFKNIAGGFWKAQATFTPTVSTIYLNMCGGSIVDGQTNKKFDVNYIKLEKGTVATPWCPNSSDALYTALGYDDGIEYDTSGYGNNGTSIDNTLTYSTDSPRYLASTVFNGTTSGLIFDNLDLNPIFNNDCTISFWVKSNDDDKRSVFFSAYSNATWAIEKTVSNHLRSYWNGSPDTVFSDGGTITSADGWIHICLVKTGDSNLKMYRNGVLTQTVTSTMSTKNFSTTWRMGRDSRASDGTPFRGNLSDFRIYASCLTDTEIQKLYTVSASIDSNGNAYSASYVEG